MSVRGNRIEIDWYGAAWQVFHYHESEVPTPPTFSWTKAPLARCRPWDSRDWYEFALQG